MNDKRLLEIMHEFGDDVSRMAEEIVERREQVASLEEEIESLRKEIDDHSCDPV